jgi:hypothetical protein
MKPIDIYSEEHAKRINTLRGENPPFLLLKQIVL